MIVTADDFVALGHRLTGPNRLRSGKAALVFDKLVSHVEPQLVLTDTGAAVDWFTMVETIRTNLIAELGSAPGELEQVAKFVTKFWKLSGQHALRQLPFIRDAKLRAVAEDDWSRAVGSAQREDAKTTAITAGSVVEAIALDIIEPIPPADTVKLRDCLNALPEDRRRKLHMSPKKTAPQDWTFAFLILALGHEGLKVLTERTHDIGHTLRDWRNYVHPDVSRNAPPLSPVDGRIAVAFAEKVIEEAEAWHNAGRSLVIPP
ncbi:hypothetical protein KH5H1_09820 [Corallococcus caeni]|uniref:hypothetical protein n=1 Tax=Corallococcus caeni TaxID=3082388 RepID=UPI0029574833|nr:hypothetical protein KH5H1_09820 [Corallococcus sp. KH5-1]